MTVRENSRTEPALALVGPLGVSTDHDFDFLAGSWVVEHRRLKSRLAQSEQWETFSGTSVATTLLGGRANIDDNILDLPGGQYRAVTLRSFDPVSRNWSIWWLDGRHPHRLDTPVVGGFYQGVGIFFADDRFEGKPIRVRFIWSDISQEGARWQQAFSADGGATWETNWMMEFRRTAPAASPRLVD
jgi:hypothetical protein